MAKGPATDDLIGMVAKQAGISEDQAKKAVDAVWDFLDDKLPEPLAGQIDKVLAGGDISDLGGLGKSLGSMFGR
jgi:nucleoid DNA-binding protein